MDAVIITCPRCGHTEGYAHPDSVAERKQCLGCLAKELIRGGLLYHVRDLIPKPTTTQPDDQSGKYEDEEDGEFSDELDPDAE